MAKKRTKTRVTSKIDELPEGIRRRVNELLTDSSNTYLYISEYLKSEGFEVSKSSVGRYAMRSNTAIQRLMEAQAQTEKLVQVVRKNPESDYTDAALIMLMDGLVTKLATAEDEFNELPLDKAGRLIASLSRTKVYKDKTKADMAKKAELAFREMESEILKTIGQDEQSAAQLRAILTRAKERMMEND